MEASKVYWDAARTISVCPCRRDAYVHAPRRHRAPDYSPRRLRRKG